MTFVLSLAISYIPVFSVHSFLPDIYIAPLQETYSEALSVQLRSKRNVLRSLQKEDMLFWGSRRSERGSSFQVEGPITEKALCCFSAERARGTKSSPRAEERRARRETRSETSLQRSVKYDGARPVTDRQTSAEILYSIAEVTKVHKWNWLCQDLNPKFVGWQSSLLTTKLSCRKTTFKEVCETVFNVCVLNV